MNRKIISCLCLLFVTSFAIFSNSSVFAQEKEKLGVVVKAFSFEDSTKSSEMEERICKYIHLNVLNNCQQYGLYESQKLEELINVCETQMSDLFKQGEIKLGCLQQTVNIIRGSLFKNNNSYELVLEIINLNSGKIVQSAISYASTIDEFQAMTSSAIAKLLPDCTFNSKTSSQEEIHDTEIKNEDTMNHKTPEVTRKPQDLSSENEISDWSPVQFSIFSMHDGFDFQLPGRKFDIYGFRLGIISGNTVSIYGLNVVGFVSYAEVIYGVNIGGFTSSVNNVIGISIGGFFNNANNMYGINIGGFSNNANIMYGVNIGGLFNYTDNMYGMNIGGLFNYADNMYGMNIGGLFNYAKEDAYILQVSVVNIAKRMKGVQIGVVNYCQYLTGIQIGVVNIVTNGAVTYFPIINISASFDSGNK